MNVIRHRTPRISFAQFVRSSRSRRGAEIAFTLVTELPLFCYSFFVKAPFKLGLGDDLRISQLVLL